VASANDLARGLLVRQLQREKDDLLRGIQRVPADSEEGRRLRLRLRELDADRQRLIVS
jgi:DNA primase